MNTTAGSKSKKSKKRSNSTNSNSSTSRLKRRERVISCEHDPTTHKLILTNSKKLAKQIDAGRVLMPKTAGSSNDDLSFFDKFLKSITKKSELTERNRNREQEKMLKKRKASPSLMVKTKTTMGLSSGGDGDGMSKKLPKSISAPISFLKAKATTKTTSIRRQNKTGRVKINNDADQNSLDEFSLRENENEHVNEQTTVDNEKQMTIINDEQTANKTNEISTSKLDFKINTFFQSNFD